MPTDSSDCKSAKMPPLPPSDRRSETARQSSSSSRPSHPSPQTAAQTNSAAHNKSQSSSAIRSRYRRSSQRLHFSASLLHYFVASSLLPLINSGRFRRVFSTAAARRHL